MKLILFYPEGPAAKGGRVIRGYTHPLPPDADEAAARQEATRVVRPGFEVRGLARTRTGWSGWAEPAPATAPPLPSAG